MEIGSTWSTYIQPTEVLDISRSCRYEGSNGAKLFSNLPIEVGTRVLDAGSGTGAMTRSLHEYTDGGVTIHGIDSDEIFVAFSSAQAQKLGYPIEYSVDDVTNCALPDGHFDLVISSSVINHVDHEKFLLEQKRVTKTGGWVVCIVIDGYRAERMSDLGVLPAGQREKLLAGEIMKKADAGNRERFEGKWRMYRPTPLELLSVFSKAGLRDLHLEKVCLAVVPDNHDDADGFTRCLESLYENERASGMALKAFGDTEASALVDEYFGLLDHRLEQRQKLWSNGTRVWDRSEADLLVVSGKKTE